MKKEIRMGMSNAMARSLGFSPRRDIAIAPVMIDLDMLSPVARWIAERITATYIFDEVSDRIPIVAYGPSIKDFDVQREEKPGKIAFRERAYGAYYTDLQPLQISFSLYRRGTPEAVIEKTATQLVDGGSIALKCTDSGEIFILMSDKVLNRLWHDALKSPDIDAFVSEWARRVFQTDAKTQDDRRFIEQLRTIWHIANDSYKDLFKFFGLNQTQVSTRFCIPLRTVQRWAAEDNTPPPYVRLMMAEAKGLIKLVE